jgi:hypothetical protein
MQSNMPLYQGYKYDGTYPVRTDNSQEYGAPSKRNLQIYLNLVPGYDRWYLPAGQMPQDLPDPKFTPEAAAFAPTIQMQSDALLILSPPAMEIGNRYFAKAGTGTIGALYDVSQLAITMALKMPYRIRMCSTTVSDDYPNLPSGKLKDWRKARRAKTVYVKDAHLWLIDYQAIYDLKQDDYVIQQGFAPLRGALGSTITSPGRLRDDRRRLVVYHTMVSTWYMNPRRRIVYGLNCCAMMSQRMVKNGDYGTQVTFQYPRMGNYIPQMTAAGQTLDVGTVVTGVHYDHQKGETICETDWFDLEVN